MTTAEGLLADVAAASPPGGADAAGRARSALADTLAVGIAGLSERSARSVRAVLPEAVDGVRPWDGGAVLGIADVALLHGTACHGLDWDDYMHPMHGHCSAVLLPATWGLAEHGHRRGADLVEAYLVGYQVDYLVSLVLSHGHYRRGWHATSTIGVLGAAAAAAHLLGLDPDSCAAALGIAASSASGIQASFGTPTKALHAGFAARAGVQAAQLAATGMTAGRRWLTGQHGVLDTYGGDVPSGEASHVISEAIASGTHGITTEMGLVQKPFASCGCSHAAVEATARAVGAAAADEIERIVVHVDPAVTRTMRETVPSDAFDSRYSVSWVVAVAAVDGTATPAQFSPGSLERPHVRALRERVEVVPDLVAGDEDRFAAVVEAHLRDGVRRAEVRHAAGHPRRPFDLDAGLRKRGQALSLVSHDPTALGAVVGGAWQADDVASVGDEIRRLCGPR